MHREKVFGEVLERKCSLLDWNIIDLTPPLQIFIFLKGLVHGSCQRFDIIFCNQYIVLIENGSGKSNW